MKVLISPKSIEEAKNAVEGGADIIDVKRPEEGSLGANFPLVIRQIRKIVPKNIKLSATLGDCGNKPGSIVQSAVGAAFAGADFVKMGFYAFSNLKDVQFVLENTVKNIKEFFPKVKVIAAGYADYKYIGSVCPLDFVEVCKKSGAHGVLIDTFRKDQGGLFDYFDVNQLKIFVNSLRKDNLISALAGRISEKDLDKLKKINPDIIGVRSIVCEGPRIEGKITARKVKEFIQKVKQ